MEKKINKANSVFISHIGDEAPVALKLKNLLQEVFTEAIQVFVSSDYESISTGEEWYRRIVESIKSSKWLLFLSQKNLLADRGLILNQEWEQVQTQRCFQWRLGDLV